MPLAHWLQFNSWMRRDADEKSWRSQFMMRQHQFIYKNEQSKNRRICFLLLLLFSACVGVPRSECNELWGVTYMGLGLALLHLYRQMRCLHFCQCENSPLRTSPIYLPTFFFPPKNLLKKSFIRSLFLIFLIFLFKPSLPILPSPDFFLLCSILLYCS